jgi:2-methylisocitrate lyase-like PEP mutase family enzyme
MRDPASARKRFRALHESGCFVMPNAWDRGSAMALASLGFPALATTSSGFAWTRGLNDGEAAVSREEALLHIRDLSEATELPVNADFQSCYGKDPEEVAESVRLCVATGTAGLSIEDASGDSERPLFEIGRAVERVAAARAAIDGTGSGVVLTARAECFLYAHPSLEDALKRLRAYAAAGADVLYAPGITTREEIAAVVEAAAPKPVNVLVWQDTGITREELEELGVRRISVGGALARAAWTGFLGAARTLAEKGSFDGFRGLVTSKELVSLFGGR